MGGSTEGRRPQDRLYLRSVRYSAPGHVSLLERARKLCDRLLVAVNSDFSVQN